MRRTGKSFCSIFAWRRVAAAMMLAVVSTTLSASEFDSGRLGNWHQWRGPDASGVAVSGNPPVSWSGTENVQWKTPLDGQGSSTPIVWGDRVFLLTSIRTDENDPNLPKPEDQPKRPFGITFPNVAYKFVVICLDRNNGRELWRKVAAQKIPHEGHHGDNNFASASPTTDGERLYVWFGPVGMFCYDLDGELLWHRDLGKVSTRRSFGEASSPVVHGDRLIINRDHEGQSYIAVLDAKTGKDVWRAERVELSTWMTPLIVRHGERTQLVTSATNRVRSYDLADGSLIWQCGGQVFNVTPSPVTDGNLVFCMSGYRGSSLYALPLDATGDITDTDRIAWKLKRGTPYVPSPLLMGGLLYFNQSNDAIVSAVDAKSGEIVIERTRMPGLSRVYASPVGAAGRVYFTGRSGTTLVLKHGRKFEVLATNSIGEPIDASPAIVGRQLFLRGRRHLYCIAE
jgi:outer membrane protein assembly factor BamB